MPSLLTMYQHPLLKSSSRPRSSSPSGNQSPPTRNAKEGNHELGQHFDDEEERDCTDFFLGDDQSNESDSDSSLDYIAAKFTHFRSRMRGRNSPTQSSQDGSVLPLIQSDSSDSESVSPPPSSKGGSHYSASKGILSSLFHWMLWLVLAVVLTKMMHNAVGFALSLQYYPTRGVMYPNALEPYVSKPTFHYDATARAELPPSSQPVHIPRIVHVTYKSREELPPEWEYSIKQWEKMHPDWELRFWSDKDIAEFVHNEYPEMEELWKSYKFMIQRVDSVRYMILHHFGGLYSDMDIYPATSLDKLLQQWEDAGKNVLLAESFNMGVTNAFMASAPQSAFMKCVVDNLPKYQHIFLHSSGWQHWEVLSSAGSTYLWAMVGHCYDDQIDIMEARSFRGCSVCDAWETGEPPASCDTQWLHHSSTNSSWHQHASWFHSLFLDFSYSFVCRPLRSCFLCVVMFLALVRRYWFQRATVKS